MFVLVRATVVQTRSEVKPPQMERKRNITIVDARMGRGKSSAAIRYMNRYKGSKCFLYITPYLTEVDRVCEKCDFEEPDCDYMSKSNQLKELMRKRCNIASTHSLFSIMDSEALSLAREQGYSLIVDESLSVIQSVSVSPRDKQIIIESLATIDEDNRVHWNEADYEGKFEGYKAMADAGTLYYCGGTMYEVMSPDRLEVFDEIFMLTYMFDGQFQKAYLDFFGFEYNIVGVERDEAGYYFSNRPDEPPNIDYSGLIHIVGLAGGADTKMNVVGDGRTSLSASWFKQRNKDNEDIKCLRGHMRNFFDRKTKSSAGRRLWTTYRDSREWMYGPRNRYASNFLSLNARATNAHKDADCVAYLVNRFIDPNIAKFFAAKDIIIDPEQFALSEMLQFIWRSAIRDDKPINLYIPSRRMRSLLLDWIQQTSNGGNT